MSKEQWIIYLYGIWPDGGYQVLWVLMLSTSLIVLVFLAQDASFYDSKAKEDNRYYKKSIWYKLGKYKIIIPTILLLFIFLSSFVPNKNTFIALVATPSLIESLENGKLKKINELIDIGLDKAIDNLKGDK